MNAEIEKKYLIKRPSIEILSSQSMYELWNIEQTYLNSAPGVTHRVRRILKDGAFAFYETKKIRVSAVFAYESEREIAEIEYRELLKAKREGTRTIKKDRHRFMLDGQIFEIDFYPEWLYVAVLETELASVDTVVNMPAFLGEPYEVTELKKYKNFAMAQNFPNEPYDPICDTFCP